MEAHLVYQAIVALRLAQPPAQAMLRKVMVHNDAMENLVESQNVDMMRRPNYLPLPIYGQKNVFIVDQSPTLQQPSFNSNVFCDASSTGPSFNPSCFCSKTTDTPAFSTNNRKKKNNYTSSYENSIEYRTLIQMFSSGVRLHELNSIATILSSLLSGVKEPNRDTKRSFPLLIQWFHANWELILPVLPCIQLRDENNQVIDGRREIIEKSLQFK